MSLHVTRAAADSQRLHLLVEKGGHSRRLTELFSEETRALSSESPTHAAAPETLSEVSGEHTAGTRPPFLYVGPLRGLRVALAAAILGGAR